MNEKSLIIVGCWFIFGGMAATLALHWARAWTDNPFIEWAVVVIAALGGPFSIIALTIISIVFVGSQGRNDDEAG